MCVWERERERESERLADCHLWKPLRKLGTLTCVRSCMTVKWLRVCVRIVCVYSDFHHQPLSVAARSSSHCCKDWRGKKKSSGASVFCKRLVSLNLFYFYGFLNNCVNWTLLSCSAVFPQLSLSPVFFFKQLMLTKFWSILTCNLLLKAWLKAGQKSRHPETVPHLIILKEGNDWINWLQRKQGLNFGYDKKYPLLSQSITNSVSTALGRIFFPLFVFFKATNLAFHLGFFGFF